MLDLEHGFPQPIGLPELYVYLLSQSSTELANLSSHAPHYLLHIPISETKILLLCTINFICYIERKKIDSHLGTWLKSITIRRIPTLI